MEISLYVLSSPSVVNKYLSLGTQDKTTAHQSTPYPPHRAFTSVLSLEALISLHLTGHELTAAAHVTHDLLFELCHLLSQHTGCRCQLCVLSL